MFLINSAYEQARFADIQRHVAQEQQKSAHMDEGIQFLGVNRRPAESFFLLLLGMMAMLSNLTLR